MQRVSFLACVLVSLFCLQQSVVAHYPEYLYQYRTTRCYQCSVTNDPACRDPLGAAASQYLVDCPDFCGIRRNPDGTVSRVCIASYYLPVRAFYRCFSYNGACYSLCVGDMCNGAAMYQQGNGCGGYLGPSATTLPTISTTPIIGACTRSDFAECAGLTAAYCPNYPDLKVFCPYLCGQCIGQVTTTTVVTPTTTIACSLTCKNLGILDPTTCTCQCLPNSIWTGLDCGTRDCTKVAADPSYCAPSVVSQLSPAQCGTDVRVPALCPYMCFLCSTTPTVPVTPTPLPCSLVCKNLGVLNTATCTCACLPNSIWTGNDCATPTCTLFPADPVFCGTQFPAASCPLDPRVPAICPYLCKICLPAGPKLPPSPTPCTLKCKNYGVLNPGSCTCSCVPELVWTGIDCGTKDCKRSAKDPAFCGSLVVATACQTDYAVNAVCPYLCKSC